MNNRNSGLGELCAFQANNTTKFFAAVVLLTLIINLVFVLKVKAQLVTGNNVTITNTTDIAIKGDVLLQSNTSIKNNGTLTLQGEWVNNSGNNCFGTSNGTVILVGHNQTIAGTSPTAFNNLHLQGTGTIKLMQHATCGGDYVSPTGVFSIGNQIFDLNSYTLTVNNSAVNAITNNSGFILSEKTDNSSKLVWRINSNAGAHIIPFGNNAGAYIPFTFDLTSGNAGDVSFSTYATNAANLPLPVTPVAVTNLFNFQGNDNSANVVDRFWQIDNTSPCTANLSFTYGNSEIAANGNFGMVAQSWNNPAQVWNAPLLLQTNPAVNTVFTPSVQQFGAWAISKQSNPLPVALLKYEAKPIGNIARNTWITASEKDNDYFTIERSTDAKNFVAIGRIEGQLSTSTSHSYIFDDLFPLNGISYYRLKQTDINGAFSYSEVRKINFERTNNFQVEVYPNPTVDGVFVSSSLRVVNDIAIYTSNGNLIKSLTTNEVVTKVDMTDLPAGNYFLQIKNDEATESVKIIKL